MLGTLSGFWLFGQFVAMEGSNWLNAFWVIGGLATIAFLLLASTPLDESGSILKESHLYDDFLEMLKLYGDALVLIFIVSIFLYVFIEQGINNWLPTFNNKVLHISAAMSIEMASILSASIALGRLAAGFILKRLSWYWLLLSCLIGAILMVALVLPLEHTPTHVIHSWKDISAVAFLFPLIGFFLAPIYPTLCSTILSTLPKYRHSAMMSLIMVFSAVGGTVGSKMVGWTFGLVGGRHALGITLIPLIVLLTLLFPYKLLRRRRLATLK